MTRPSSGEVWWVDLEPAKGQEMNKTRPAVVISGDSYGALAVKLIVPLTSASPAKTGKVWLVPIGATKSNGLPKDSVADALQSRGVSLSRFKTRMGRLSADDLEEVAAAVALVVEAP